MSFEEYWNKLTHEEREKLRKYGTQENTPQMFIHTDWDKLDMYGRVVSLTTQIIPKAIREKIILHHRELVPLLFIHQQVDTIDVPDLVLTTTELYHYATKHTIDTSPLTYNALSSRMRNDYFTPIGALAKSDIDYLDLDEISKYDISMLEFALATFDKINFKQLNLKNNKIITALLNTNLITNEDVIEYWKELTVRGSINILKEKVFKEKQLETIWPLTSPNQRKAILIHQQVSNKFISNKINKLSEPNVTSLLGHNQLSTSNLKKLFKRFEERIIPDILETQNNLSKEFLELTYPKCSESDKVSMIKNHNLLSKVSVPSLSLYLSDECSIVREMAKTKAEQYYQTKDKI